MDASTNDTPSDPPMVDVEQTGGETEMTDLQSPMERAEEADAAGASLPHPDEVRASGSARPAGEGGFLTRKGSSSLCIFFFFMLLVIVLSVTLGVTLSNRDEEEKDKESRAAAERIQNYVLDLGISQPESFTSSLSPQSLAVQWLVYEDELNLQAPPAGTDPDENNDAYELVVRYVMVVLYHSTGGPGWRYQFDFLSEKETCAWNGVLISSTGGLLDFGLVCTRQSNRAWGLYLDAMNITGTLPEELNALTTLNSIDFNFNDDLTGPFPSALCAMTNIQAISLGYNQMNGNLPTCINELTDLRLLFLPNTNMGGNLPSMDRMISLEKIFLDDNQFVGDISSVFDDMPGLRFLLLENNRFSGTIDSTFLAYNNDLVQADISGNRLEGDVPVHLMEFSQMQLLDLHGNSLGGDLPTAYPASDAMLFLALHDNNLDGTIDPSIAQLSRLFHLDLSNNRIRGDIIPELGSMANLTYLYLGQNNFEPGPLPDFSGLVKMREFSVKGTDRTGDLPDYIGTWEDLLLLDMDDNDFNGTIPLSWGNLSNLEFLLVNDNSLSGEVPSTFSSLLGLRAAFFEGNTLEGDLGHLCALANFNELKGDLDGDEVLVADCKGGAINCTCCVCCDPTSDNDDNGCNDHEMITSLTPKWEFLYERVRFDFGNDTRFVDRSYLP